MSHRIHALSPMPLADDEALLTECQNGVDVADWWICAEFAGIEDDDEASALVDRICDSQTVKIERSQARPILELSYDAGKITFQALRGHARAKTHELRMFLAPEAFGAVEPHFSRVVDAVEITITGFTGIEADIVARVCHGVAIGLVSERGGIVVEGASVWDPGKSKYIA